MSITIRRIEGRCETKTFRFAASWEAFDETDYFFGRIHDIGSDENPTFVFDPLPDSLGYTESNLRYMLEALRVAKIARRQELGGTNGHDTNAARPTHPDIVLPVLVESSVGSSH